MKRAVFTILFLAVVFMATGQERFFEFNLQPGLGVTLHSVSNANENRKHMEWLLSVESGLNYRTKNFHFDSDVNLIFGQIAKSGVKPETTQDELIVNIMPSIRIFKRSDVRLFLQSKAETRLAKGWADDQETNFLDPMFLTHTLFVGDKKFSVKLKEKNKFNLAYGLGYSFVQIITKNFIPSSEDLQTGDGEFIHGPTAVFNFKFNRSINEDVSMSLMFNNLYLMKSGFFKDTGKSRFSSMLNASLDYKIFTIQYNCRLLFDREISFKRQLNQSLVFGVKLTL
ncbi:MAG: hypothetical protein Q8R90_10390 [Bacteroidales bacterium]|nr:hypothetical protein [Bacteroidales bacterium]